MFLFNVRGAGEDVARVRYLLRVSELLGPNDWSTWRMFLFVCCIMYVCMYEHRLSKEGPRHRNTVCPKTGIVPVIPAPIAGCCLLLMMVLLAVLLLLMKDCCQHSFCDIVKVPAVSCV